MTAAPHTVGILGGMGPAAGADFVREFVAACADRLAALGQRVDDQSFPEHWLAQVPVPDRTRALRGAPAASQPLDAMLLALGRLVALGSRAVALACNTAHAWHAPLQERFPQTELLHVAGEVASDLAARGVARACLLATEGTYASRLYANAFAAADVELVMPDAGQRARLMRGIYEGVKAGRVDFARDEFAGVVRELERSHPGSAMVLACTEIPLALRDVRRPFGAALVDPTQVLARALAARAYA